ncbi:hypothetical protein M427DRAFT_192356 [Gonapodya prolifera JEL478]|uniref:Uncharacterized protein n=1 Tax=Gonapodya prolifera (strain JEL478) TaxID=1344416 RepID=A0A139A059_GONPJ|nr:hypothetical protein M427DRAFT_192356 [Gonapodya prolifera JEL478]|eukprot:KXS10114.1 hypothetical protein M427DRAFT_192356 [Gonapodya prolifera JEL478]
MKMAGRWEVIRKTFMHVQCFAVFVLRSARQDVCCLGITLESWFSIADISNPLANLAEFLITHTYTRSSPIPQNSPNYQFDAELASTARQNVANNDARAAQTRLNGEKGKFAEQLFGGESHTSRPFPPARTRSNIVASIIKRNYRSDCRCTFHFGRKFPENKKYENK